jgi:hypothetical protein
MIWHDKTQLARQGKGIGATLPMSIYYAKFTGTFDRKHAGNN